MRYLTIILISFMAVSCMTTKRIKKHCAEFQQICEVPVKKEVEIIRDTKTEIQFRDTTIYIPAIEKIVHDTVYIEVEKGISNSEKSVLSVPFAESWAQVKDSELQHKLIQKDSIRHKLKDALKTIRVLNTEKWKSEQENTITIKENTRFAKFAIMWLIFCIVAVVGYIAWKLKGRLYD